MHNFQCRDCNSLKCTCRYIRTCTDSRLLCTSDFEQEHCIFHRKISSIRLTERSLLICYHQFFQCQCAQLFHFPKQHMTSCYIMPAARAYLQISLGKTRSTPTCMHELIRIFHRKISSIRLTERSLLIWYYQFFQCQCAQLFHFPKQHMMSR